MLRDLWRSLCFFSFFWAIIQLTFCCWNIQQSFCLFNSGVVLENELVGKNRMREKIRGKEGNSKQIGWSDYLFFLSDASTFRVLQKLFGKFDFSLSGILMSVPKKKQNKKNKQTKHEDSFEKSLLKFLTLEMVFPSSETILLGKMVRCVGVT